MDIRRGTVGVVDYIPPQKNIGEVVSGLTSTGRYSTGKRKLNTSSVKNIIALEVKRSKVQELDDIGDEEETLLSISGKVYDVYPTEVVCDGSSNKKDDSPVPFRL